MAFILIFSFHSPLLLSSYEPITLDINVVKPVPVIILDGIHLNFQLPLSSFAFLKQNNAPIISSRQNIVVENFDSQDICVMVSCLIAQFSCFFFPDKELTRTQA